MAGYNDKIIEEFRSNGGKVSSFGGMSLLLLTTVGAKSSQPHTTPVAFTRDGEDYVVVASYGGNPNNPAWYHNLIARPEVTVEVGSEKFQAVARVTSPEERDRLFEAHATVYPAFRDYRKKTDREIPVIVLTHS